MCVEANAERKSPALLIVPNLEPGIALPLSLIFIIFSPDSPDSSPHVTDCSDLDLKAKGGVMLGRYRFWS